MEEPRPEPLILTLRRSSVLKFQLEVQTGFQDQVLIHVLVRDRTEEVHNPLPGLTLTKVLVLLNYTGSGGVQVQT